MSKLPPLPPHCPKLPGSKVLQKLTRWASQATPWSVGELPNIAKAVVIAAPHSSNWDGLFGIVSAFGIGLRINWLGKAQLFRWPIKNLMLRFGGVATDRNSSHGVVDQIADKFHAVDSMWLVLAPEGTRKKVKKWRTGFWHIAKRAGVPIIAGYLHYPEKRIGFGITLWPSEDMEADLQKLYDFYRQYQGKNGKIGLPTG
jgi:1-acyl-sn-glycerol-3-phosphate acyltransferase